MKDLTLINHHSMSDYKIDKTGSRSRSDPTPSGGVETSPNLDVQLSRSRRARVPRDRKATDSQNIAKRLNYGDVRTTTFFL